MLGSKPDNRPLFKVKARLPSPSLSCLHYAMGTGCGYPFEALLFHYIALSGFSLPNPMFSGVQAVDNELIHRNSLLMAQRGGEQTWIIYKT